MSIDFTVEPVEELPKKQSRKERSSKYQTIIDEFLSSKYSLVRVDTDVKTNNLSIVLNRLLKKRGIKNVKISVRNGALYLEK